MSTRKLIVKISYGLIAGLVLVLIGLLIYQPRLVRQVSDNEQQDPSAMSISGSNAQEAKNLPQTTPPVEDDKEQLSSEVDTLRYQLEAAEEELDMAREDLANERDEQLGDNSDLFAIEKKTQENQTLMNMRRRDEEYFINEDYGALFERLGLSDEKIQGFKSLLVDYEMQRMENRLIITDPSLAEEVKKEKLLLLSEAQNAELGKQLRDLLGSENYEAYNAYQERMTERAFITNFINYPNTDLLSLSDEKEQALIDSMYEARKEVEAEHGIDSSDIMQTLGIMNQNPEEEMDRQFEIYDRYIESARGVLSESQARQFETRINEEKEMRQVNRSL